MTNVTDAVNLYDMLIAVNQLSGGLIGIFLLTSIFLLIFMVFKKYEQDTKEVLLIDSVITSIIGVLFWSMGLISITVLIYPVILFFVSAIAYKFL